MSSPLPSNIWLESESDGDADSCRRRLLTGIRIVDMDTLNQAITSLHTTYLVPHVIITSIQLPSSGATPHLSVVGSTLTSATPPRARIFKIDCPSLDCFFSGTGDMFAALMVVRLREAVAAIPGLSETKSWISDDSVQATDLPLARASELVLASMNEVLTRTKKRRDEEVGEVGAQETGREEDQKRMALKRTRATEVRLVRNLDCLKWPEVRFRAETLQ